MAFRKHQRKITWKIILKILLKNSQSENQFNFMINTEL